MMLENESRPFKATLPTTPVRWAFEAGAWKGLAPEERHVLVAIASHCSSHHWSASVSRATVAEMTGYRIRVVADAFHVLKRRDLIQEIPAPVGSADPGEIRLKGQPRRQR